MWYSIFTVGDIDIDQGHANIDFMLSALGSEAGDPESAVLENIIDVTNQHFTNEETIAKERGYNMIAKHLAKHQQLTKELLVIKQSLQNRDTSRESIPAMLRDILNSHILEFDRFLIT